MDLDLSDLKTRVQQQIAGAKVNVESDGYYVTITVVSDSFTDMSAVQRQRTVYAALAELIADGRLHAVNIVAQTPTEAAAA